MCTCDCVCHCPYYCATQPMVQSTFMYSFIWSKEFKVQSSTALVEAFCMRFQIKPELMYSDHSILRNNIRKGVSNLVAPGLTPSMSQLSLLLRIRRMVSACSFVKPTLTSGAGLFPPFSHMSVIEEKKAFGDKHQLFFVWMLQSWTKTEYVFIMRNVCQDTPETFHWCLHHSGLKFQSNEILCSRPKAFLHFHLQPAFSSGQPMSKNDTYWVQHILCYATLICCKNSPTWKWLSSGPCWHTRQRWCSPCWLVIPSPASSLWASYPEHQNSPLVQHHRQEPPPESPYKTHCEPVKHIASSNMNTPTAMAITV